MLPRRMCPHRPPPPIASPTPPLLPKPGRVESIVSQGVVGGRGGGGGGVRVGRGGGERDAPNTQFVKGVGLLFFPSFFLSPRCGEVGGGGRERDLTDAPNTQFVKRVGLLFFFFSLSFFFSFFLLLDLLCLRSSGTRPPPPPKKKNIYIKKSLKNKNRMPQ